MRASPVYRSVLKVALAGAIGLSLASCGPTGETPSPIPSIVGLGAAPVLSPAMPSAEATNDPIPSPSSVPTAAPALTALVPVVNFWSPVTDVSSADLRTLLSGGTSQDFRQIVVESGEGPALLGALGLDIAGVNELPAAAIFASLKSGELGLVKIDDLVPQVSALKVDGLSLFGYQRISGLARWPLLVPENGAGFDYGALWTLAGGGDVNLDRAVYRTSVLEGRGPDYPWSGGTSVIGGYTCCGAGNNPLAVGRSSGEAGAFRAVFAGSDIALVNLEGPAPDKFSYHPDGFTFTFDPALLAGLTWAGISAVGLANNHIRNAGSTGVLDTIANLDEVGLAHAGAGANLAAAAAPATLSAGGQRIAFLSFDAIAPVNWASAKSPGAAPLDINAAVADIRAAKAAGADIVIVMPHWGTEYSTAISAAQRSEAAAMVAAGADVILGSHSHWLNGISLQASANGVAFVDYSLGDLIFDLNYDERTQEAAVVNLTFAGTRLLQVKLIPTLVLAYSQGSLLTGTGAAKVLADIAAASH